MMRGVQLLRLTLLTLFAVAAGGAGAVFIWSTMNDVFQGSGSLARALLALIVLAGLAALFAWIVRYVRQLEELE